MEKEHVTSIVKSEVAMKKQEEEEEEDENLHQPLCDKEEKEGAERNGEVRYSFVTTPPTTTTTTTTITYKKGGWGARHTLVTLACVGVILMSMMRYGLSIAIVSMVTRPAADHRHRLYATTANTTAAPFLTNLTTSSSTGLNGGGGGGGGGVCPAPGVDGVDGGINGTLDGVHNDSITRFEWDEKAQGHVLGAFYYGYFLTNILGGRLAERAGGKPVIAAGMLLSSLLSLVSPLAAHLSTGVFIGVRLVQGLSQGVLVPAFNRCLVMWVPPYKRSKYNTFVFIGSEVGIVLSMTVGGYLCSQPSVGGWTAVFYGFGGAGVLWCVVWWVVARESPHHHNGMSAEEKEYLTAYCVVQQEQVSVAWCQVFSSLPFWSLVVMHIGYNWGYYTFVSVLPAYMANMQHFTVRNNGIVSALPYVAECSFGLLFSVAVDRATASGRLSVLAVRRLAMAVASYIPAAALAGMCLVGCDSAAAVAVVCVAIGAGGSAFCGLFSSHQDLAPNLAGTLLGVTNSIANVMGFLAPALVGVITFRNQTVWAWNTVFLLSAAIYLFSATFYITCVTDQVQPFNDPTQVQDGHVEEVKVEKHDEGKHAKQLPPPEAS